MHKSTSGRSRTTDLGSFGSRDRGGATSPHSIRDNGGAECGSVNGNQIKI